MEKADVVEPFEEFQRVGFFRLWRACSESVAERSSPQSLMSDFVRLQISFASRFTRSESTEIKSPNSQTSQSSRG